MVQLDIFSDPVCPWCLIGKTRLDRALEQIGDHPFRIEWHPFQLHPDMPQNGMDRRDFLETAFDGQMNAARAYVEVQRAADELGLELNLGAIERQPNTLNAHRLIHWAGLEGRQTAIVSALFKAYFREGRDIGDAGTLADIAAASGMDRDLTARLLASEADLDDIRARDADARHKGVKAVPTYLVDRRYVVSGAQTSDWWKQVAEEIAAKLQAGEA